MAISLTPKSIEKHIGDFIKAVMKKFRDLEKKQDRDAGAFKNDAEKAIITLLGFPLKKIMARQVDRNKFIGTVMANFNLTKIEPVPVTPLTTTTITPERRTAATDSRPEEKMPSGRSAGSKQSPS